MDRVEKLVTVLIAALIIFINVQVFLHHHETGDERKKWTCEILAVELEISRKAWEDVPKKTGYNLKSDVAADYFKSYNLFNTTCTDVH